MEPDSFQVHVDIDVDRPGEYRELTRWWLDSLHAEFVDRPGFDVQEARRLESGWGYCRDSGPTIVGDYDHRARERFAEELEAGPGDASFDVYGTHQTGGPVVWVKLRSHIPVGEPTKVEVWVELALLKTAAAGEVDQVEAALLGLLARFLDRWRPLFAGISDDFDRHSVSLDKAQNLNSRVARLDSSRFLRCYCWVTYCPDRFQKPLPGLTSDAVVFVKTTRFSDGVLLQVTEHLRDFEGDRVRAVRDALAPVLRPRATNQPRRPGPRMRKRHLRIAWDDGSNGPFAPRPTRAEIAAFRESVRRADETRYTG